MAALTRAWRWWLGLTAPVTDFQSRLVTTVFYWTALVPFGLITRLFANPLRDHEPRWSHRPEAPANIESATRQS